MRFVKDLALANDAQPAPCGRPRHPRGPKPASTKGLEGGAGRGLQETAAATPAG